MVRNLPQNGLNKSFTIFVDVIKLLKTYRLNTLKKSAAKVSREMRLCSLNQVQKVGILWAENDSRAFNYIHDFFKSPKVIIRNLCFTNNKEQTDSNMITPKDLNWLGFPSGGNIDNFIKTDFDLLFNLNVNPLFFALDAIAALSVAHFKTGWDHAKTGFYDLSIDVSAQPDASYLAEQQINYLKQLNKNIDL